MTFQGAGSLSPLQFPFRSICPAQIPLLSLSSFLLFYLVMSQNSCHYWSLGSSASNWLLFCVSRLSCRCFCFCFLLFVGGGECVPYSSTNLPPFGFLTLSFLWSSSSSCFRCNVRLFIYDFCFFLR